MIDDIMLSRRSNSNDPSTIFSEKQQQFFALAEIDKLLKSIGKSIKHYSQLPQPPASYLHSGLNNLVIDETSYNLTDMEREFNKLIVNCNPEQLAIFNELRSEGLIVLPVASSGIAATLIHGGRTAHSRFKIPIVLDDCFSCAIRHDSDIAELIKTQVR
ncbi:uncharacterized protein LOC141696064 [Apium graveolens]|uniref:uncharacterized protein LOC141696064 n=1 Tax=Apium graveolens TaxID=4045 RepID=UPI003D796A19